KPVPGPVGFVVGGGFGGGLGGRLGGGLADARVDDSDTHPEGRTGGEQPGELARVEVITAENPDAESEGDGDEARDRGRETDDLPALTLRDGSALHVLRRDRPETPAEGEHDERRDDGDARRGPVAESGCRGHDSDGG